MTLNRWQMEALLIAVLSLMVLGSCRGAARTPDGRAIASQKPRILILVTSADRLPDGQPTGLWLEEYAVPYQAFVEAGYPVDTVTIRGGAVPIDPRSDPSAEQRRAWAPAIRQLQRTRSLAEVKAADYQTLFIPGGHGAMLDLARHPQVARLVERLDAAGAVIAALCHGPAALVEARTVAGEPLVAGRRLTAFSDAEERAVQLEEAMPFLLESRLRELGAQVEVAPAFKGHVIRDGRWITGQNPASSAQMAREVLVVLEGAAARSGGDVFPSASRR